MAIQVGSPAPRFECGSYLHNCNELKPIGLDDYQGKWLCLYFYPYSFSPVCQNEVGEFDAAREEFQRQGCELLACSTDSNYIHRAWCESVDALNDLGHPILSDMNKQTSMDYGVLLPEKGVALRATFLINPDAMVCWSGVNDIPIGRNVPGVLRELDGLLAGQPNPCEIRK